MKLIKLLFIVFVGVFLYSHSAYAQVDYTDKAMIEKLNSGYGAAVIGLRSFKEIPQIRKLIKNDQSLLKPENIHKLFEQEKWVLRGDFMYLEPNEKFEEKKFKRHRMDGFFILFAMPGEYKLTRINWHIPAQTFSYRIYQSFVIEPGKIKHLGDFQVHDFKKIIKSKQIKPSISLWHGESTLENTFKEKYPEASKFLVKENIFENQKTEEKP